MSENPYFKCAPVFPEPKRMVEFKFDEALKQFDEKMRSQDRDGQHAAMMGFILQLSEVLVQSASAGSESASTCFATITRALVQEFAALSEMDPTTQQLVRTMPEMPGWISTKRLIMDSEIERAQRLEQGSEANIPDQIGADKNRLVKHLVNYVELHRIKFSQIPAEFRNDEHGEISKISQLIMRLPDLTEDTIEVWRKGFLAIVKQGGQKPAQCFSDRFPTAFPDDGKWGTRIEQALKLHVSGIPATGE